MEALCIRTHTPCSHVLAAAFLPLALEAVAVAFFLCRLALGMGLPPAFAASTFFPAGVSLNELALVFPPSLIHCVPPEV